MNRIESIKLAHWLDKRVANIIPTITFVENIHTCVLTGTHKKNNETITTTAVGQTQEEAAAKTIEFLAVSIGWDPNYKVKTV